MGSTYTYDQIIDVANRAADMVVDELELPDTGSRDVVNLVVNAIGSLLREPDTNSLNDVIRDNYEEEPDEVRSWVE